jgi:hypothetical protein
VRGAVAGALPNLIVIGAMKAGTSALHYYLDLHPEIAMSRPKELDFFVDGELQFGAECAFDREDLRVEGTFDANWSKGLGWYERHFSPEAPVRGEASPSYTAPWYPDVAARMALLLPEAKLVFLVRDPVERAVSNYQHQHALGRERRTIDQALGNVRGPYAVRSLYGLAIELFLERFPRESVLVATQEELRHRRRETVQAVYRFAGVDDSFWSPEVERERYRGESKVQRGPLAQLAARSPLRGVARRLPDELKARAERMLSTREASETPSLGAAVRERLESRFREDVQRLAELTGRDFPDWSVGP